MDEETEALNITNLVGSSTRFSSKLDDKTFSFYAVFKFGQFLG